MAIEMNDDTARVIKERVTLSQYRELIAARDDAKERTAGRIWALMHSILDEIEMFGAPYASTIEAARAAMDAQKAIDAQSWRLLMNYDIVPYCLDQIEMPLEAP